jgi:hypothetical protein
MSPDTMDSDFRGIPDVEWIDSGSIAVKEGG